MSARYAQHVAAFAGDEIKAEVQLNHVGNLNWVGAFFSTAEPEEESPLGAPELVLEWEESNPLDKEPRTGPYGAGNVRRSLYEVRCTVPAQASPGVYRLRGLSFRTAGGRFVRFSREQLDPEYVASLVVEILEEQPQETQITDFRLLSGAEE